MKHEKGFHFLEFPAAAGKADALVIILHGHANHPEMFDTLPARLQQDWPTADVLIVRAPFALNASDDNKKNKGVAHVDNLYTWHKLEKRARPHVGLALSRLFNRVSVVRQLNAFIDAQLHKRHLKDADLALFGFSMGGAIAIETAARRPQPCSSVVCHSGFVLPNLRAKSKPDTLMLVGDVDNFFFTRRLTVPAPPGNGRLKKAFGKAVSKIGFHYDDSIKRLQKAGIPFEQDIIPGLRHTINEESFGKSSGFISGRLRRRAP